MSLASIVEATIAMELLLFYKKDDTYLFSYYSTSTTSAAAAAHQLPAFEPIRLRHSLPTLLGLHHLDSLCVLGPSRQQTVSAAPCEHTYVLIEC